MSESPQFCSRLKSLTVEGCSTGVCLPVLDKWVMPNLISITLDLNPILGQRDYSEYHTSLFDSLETLVGSHLLCQRALVLNCPDCSFLARPNWKDSTSNVYIASNTYQTFLGQRWTMLLSI